MLYLWRALPAGMNALNVGYRIFTICTHPFCVACPANGEMPDLVRWADFKHLQTFKVYRKLFTVNIISNFSLILRNRFVL